MKKVLINTETITLEQFLKWAGVVSTGGEAKTLIRQGIVKVNDSVETKRSKKLFPNDMVEFDGKSFLVARGGEFNET